MNIGTALSVSNQSQIFQESLQNIGVLNGGDNGSPQRGNPNLIFNLLDPISVEHRSEVLKTYLDLGEFDAMRATDHTRDHIGMAHIKYQQFHRGIEVEGATYTVHVRDREIVSLSGNYHLVDISAVTSIDEATAFQVALDHVGATEYMWEHEETDAPTGKLVFVSSEFGGASLAYKFDVYAHEPFSRDFVFVDAKYGKVLKTEDRIHDVDSAASGDSLYNGHVHFTAENTTDDDHRLRQTGDGVETYNLNNGTNYGAATDFESSSNLFDDADHGTGVQTHFGTEATLQYFQTEHGRDSYDDNGAVLRSYVSFSTNYVNAFWDGTRMTYGDGNGSSFSPLVSLDVVGHEITHGVTQHSSNLIYQNESGALNESFSDIFGEAVEFFASGTNDWKIGADFTSSGEGFRNMANPNQFNDPDTYLGDFWYTGTGDNGGVHINSGVMNKWFYLMTQGEAGTNDNGDAYDIAGLGIEKAAEIAYRNNNIYLTRFSEYADAREGSVQAAVDLYGAGSTEALTTMAAWDAVGVYSSVAPDGYGYFGTQTSFAFEDISATGTKVLEGFDDAFVELSDAALGDFSFNFFDVDYTNLFISSNGNMTFDSGNNAFSNTSYLTSPTQAGIAPYWDDLSFLESGAAYWEVRGAGDNERLIIQWEGGTYIFGDTSDPLSFQVILSEKDNAIRINYRDLTNGSSFRNEGASATLGVKDVGSQTEGDRAYVYSFNSAGAPTASGTSFRIDRCSGADSFGVDACIEDYSWVDISGTGASALAGVDNGFVGLTQADLNGFTFQFEGTTYDQLFVSSNGLITFEEGTTESANDDLSSLGAAIAPFWDDLTAESQGQVLWEVLGEGGTQQLVVTWEDVEFKSDAGGGDGMTFQAILSEFDNSVQVIYDDMVTGSLADGGLSATIGSKGADTLLVAMNETSNYVDTGSFAFIDRNIFSLEGADGVVDNFDVHISPDTSSIEHNGAIYFLTDESEIRIDGKTELDEIEIFGTASDDTAVLSKNRIAYSGDVKVVGHNFERQLARSGGGDDRATIIQHDTAKFFGGESGSKFTEGDFLSLATGFAVVSARANQPDAFGALTGTDAGEDFFAREDYASFIGGEFEIRMLDFAAVNVMANGGDDVFNVIGTAGDDRFVSNREMSIFETDNTRYVLKSFEQENAEGKGGTDEAILNGSAGNDTFSTDMDQSRLSGSGYRVTAIDFDRVISNSRGGDDRAILTGSAGDERFQGREMSSTLMGDDFTTIARGFNRTAVDGGGGLNTAFLYDTAGDDLFRSGELLSTLTSSTHFNRVMNFARVNAFATAGVDSAFMQDTTEDDTFFGRGFRAVISSENFFARANSYDSVHAKSTEGGDDELTFGTSQFYDFTSEGNWN